MVACRHIERGRSVGAGRATKNPGRCPTGSDLEGPLGSAPTRAPGGPSLLRGGDGMPRRGSVVPLIGWKPAAQEEFRPKGPPLIELFDFVDRLVWSRPGVATKSRANRMRSRELAKALPSHPSPADIGAWMCSLDAIMAPGTVDQHRRSLSAVYSYAGDYGISQGNPAKVTPRRKHRPDPRPILNINELWPALLEVCEDEREQAFLGVLRFAGLRRGEALGLKRHDVNTRDPWRLTVVRQRPHPNDLHHTPPKSEASCRELPVRDPLRELLAPLLALPDPQVWTGHGGRVVERVELLFPYREHELTGFGDRLREVAPLAFPRGHKMWHALRDSLVMEMRGAGKTWSEAAEVCGHSSEYVTRTSYGGELGRAVHRSTLAGLDPPTSGPPGMVPSGPKKRPPAVRAAGGQRRSKAGSPPVTKESKRCDTPSRSVKSQPRLPGMQVAAVVTRPARTATTAASRSTRSGAGTSGRAAATTPARAAPGTRGTARKAPPPVEWSEVVTFGRGAKPCPF